MCFVDSEKAFDQVSKKVIEWMMRKRGLLEAIVKAVMNKPSLAYTGAKTRVRVGSQLSEYFFVNVGLHQGLVLSLLLFAIVVHAVLEYAKELLLNDILMIWV